MTGSDTSVSLARIYKWTGAIGVAGFAGYLWIAGARSAFAFALGVLCSLGNVWVFDRLSSSIAPGAAARKPWQAGAYITRYILLLGIGYAIVKALNVSPLAVILGLLASTAAVLVSLIVELILQAFHSRTQH